MLPSNPCYPIVPKADAHVVLTLQTDLQALPAIGLSFDVLIPLRSLQTSTVHTDSSATPTAGVSIQTPAQPVARSPEHHPA